MRDAEDQMRTLLRQRHHLSAEQDDDFTVRNLEELFRAQETSAQVMSIACSLDTILHVRRRF